MKYLSTTMATNWPQKVPWKLKVLDSIKFLVPKANPGYEPKLHLVDKWLIEFTDEEGELSPWREIALDSNGSPLFAGPDKKNYGFWLDTNMKYQDFVGESITKHEFEKLWKTAGVKELI